MNYDALIQKALKGDSDAFCELVENCKESLYRIAYAYSKNEQGALEIVDEAVYKAYMKLETLKDYQYFKTWITRILINTAIDLTKKKDVIVLCNEDYQIDKVYAKNSEMEEDIAIEVANNLDLYTAMDRLDSKYKTLVILRYFDDLTISQISEMLEQPIGTIKGNLHRAVKQLKNELMEG